MLHSTYIHICFVNLFNRKKMFIQLNNHKAHIYNKNPIDSSKKSIVFLPGAGMDHRTLSMFKLSKIESEYNLIAIDLPGHGYTSGPPFF